MTKLKIVIPGKIKEKSYDLRIQEYIKWISKYITIEIIYLKECFYLKGLTTSQLSQLYLKFCKDHLIIADSAEPRLINELSLSSNVKASIKGQGSVLYGISLMLDYDLIVDPESENLIKELNNYKWLEKKSQTPIDNFNHLLDACRYSIGYQLKNPRSGEYNLI